MVLLTITQAAKDAIITHRRLSQQAPAPQDGEPDLRDPIVGGPVAHGQLIDITNALKKYSADEASVDCASDLETILRGSKIYTPPPKPKPEKVRLPCRSYILSKSLTVRRVLSMLLSWQGCARMRNVVHMSA